jgi:hypothetical protein
MNGTPAGKGLALKDLLETWLLNSAHHGLHVNIGRSSKTPEITREVVFGLARIHLEPS